jgi:hypothetical protein
LLSKYRTQHYSIAFTAKALKKALRNSLHDKALKKATVSINLKKAILKKAGRKSVQFLRQIPAGKAVLVTVPLAAGPFRVDDFRRSGSSSTHRASAKMVYPICKIVNSNTTYMYTVHSQENRSRRPSGKAFKTAIWKSPQEGHQDIISPQEG